MWGRVPRGNNGACSTLCRLSLPPLPTIKLGPSGADSLVGRLVYVLKRPCWSFQLTHLSGWEFLLLLQLPQIFTATGFEVFFPPCAGTLLVWSVSLPSCPSQFICMQMWDRPVCNLLLCRESSLPSCPSPSLLLFWMNVSSLTPWLSDFHIVPFSVISGCFLFLNLLLSFFWLYEKAQCVYLCFHLCWKFLYYS